MNSRSISLRPLIAAGDALAAALATDHPALAEWNERARIFRPRDRTKKPPRDWEAIKTALVAEIARAYLAAESWPAPRYIVRAMSAKILIPYKATGWRAGVYARRAEMPAPLNTLGKTRIENMLSELKADGRIVSHGGYLCTPEQLA